jgi:hypothetical protein
MTDMANWINWSINEQSDLCRNLKATALNKSFSGGVKMFDDDYWSEWGDAHRGGNMAGQTHIWTGFWSASN